MGRAEIPRYGWAESWSAKAHIPWIDSTIVSLLQGKMIKAAAMFRECWLACPSPTCLLCRLACILPITSKKVCNALTAAARAGQPRDHTQ